MSVSGALQGLPLSQPAGEARTAPSAAASSTAKNTEGADDDWEVDIGPLWFKKEAFTADEFDAAEYVRDMRRYVPLSALQQELEKLLASLKAELVELINRDYGDFVSLSTKLVDVEAVVGRMRPPLLQLKGRVKEVQAEMEGAKAALSAGLQRRRELAATRETLELLIDTSHVVSKVERLLGELADPAVAAGSAAERARLMERTASEMNRLHFNASKGSDLALVQALAPRIGAAQRALVEQLRVQLAAGLEQNSKGVIAPCFSAFASVGDVGAAQEVVRRTVIRPVVARVLAALPASAPPNDLRPPLQALSQALPAECASVISLFKSDPGLRGLSFVPEALLSESDAALAEARPQAFSPGVPAAFLANYVAAEQFLALLEGECSTPEALAAFRASAPFSAFLKRWNLSAYFSLRYQEIAAGVEAALAESDKALAHGGGAHAQQHGLSLAVSCAVVDALERCWAKEVFLPQLTDKFFKLALQVLARFSTWLHAGTRARSRADAASGGAASGAPPVGAGGGEWAVIAGVDDLAMAWQDTEKLAEVVQGPYTRTVQAHVGHAGEEGREAAAEATREAAARLREAAAPLGQLLANAISDSCVEVLKQLRGITATYRMTNKPLPTRHSHFMPTVLSPLGVFTESPRAKALPAEARSALVQAVAAAVTAKYEEMARDLVSTVKKTESSLKRLKDRRGAAAGAGGAAGAGAEVSDTEKICKQLHLDAQEFARQLAKFGVDAAQLPAFQRLWEAVVEGGEPISF